MTEVQAETVTEAIVGRLKAAGATHIFGVPGGECNLDFIAAADKLGLRFILTRTETSAAIMACVTAELTGAPGVAMTTRGPGLAAAANGVAYADLDRVPLLLIADGYEDDQAYISHQRIDQAALLSPMLRGWSDLRARDAVDEIERLIALAQAQPPGPVYLEVAGSRIRGRAEAVNRPAPADARAAADAAGLEQARTMLRTAKRPLLLAGLQARTGRASDALQRFVAQTGCPLLTTYKAKGVISEHDPRSLGLYAGGVAEQAAIRSADLLILYGFDPVEGPPQPWRYSDMAMLELTEHAFAQSPFEPDTSVVGPIDEALAALADAAPPRRWTWADGELSAFKDAIWSAARVPAGPGISPEQLVDAAIAALPADARITIDAGAHMLPVLHLWRCGSPNQSLISRGLSTMGFALPAAVAASLIEPGRTTVAFTGDGGIMMCLGELGTAVQSGAAPIVIVFNDSSLTLIGAKQRRRQLAASGVDFSRADFAQIARGFGWDAHSVAVQAELAPAFAAALASGRPTLIDVAVNPDQYDAQILAIRG